MSTVYLDGHFVPGEHAKISVDDRGFTFGDGIYEGVRAIGGKLFAWTAHAARMSDGLAGLRIDFGPAKVAELAAISEQLLVDNRLRDGEAFLYLAVSRGVAPRGHGFPTGVAPTVYASATRFTPSRDQRARGVAAITHDDLRWARCDWKTLNLLGAVLARQAAAEAGAYEAILHRDGMVTEGGATNVVVVLDGALRTHPRSPRILPGVTRQIVLDCARAAGIQVDETAVSLDELRRADEILLCGTRTDVTPVVRLDGAPVGRGTPGPIAARLQNAFETVLYSRD